jgi:predicted phage baseplate assembly protein
MALPLPNLDDRRWDDLVEEGRALIPFYAPEWTDHNAHDPGITLVELLAWVAEMDVFQLNRIPERHRRKFLALAGIVPAPPRPARTLVTVALRAGSEALELPAGTELEGDDPFGVASRFRTLTPLTAVEGELRALQFSAGSSINDVTNRWRRGQPVRPFGDDPAPGAAFYLGLSAPLPGGRPVSLFFIGADFGADERERQRLLAERAAGQAACRMPPTLRTCDETSGGPTNHHPPEHPQTAYDTARANQDDAPLVHHSVRVVWEFLAGGDRWQRLDADASEVRDETRALTLNGRVVVTLPGAMTRARVGVVDAELYYLRCRVLSGTHDAPPELTHVALNGVLAEQAATSRLLGVPMPGHPDVKADLLGEGTTQPYQEVGSSERPVLESSFRLFTVEDQETWVPWTRRADFDASTRSDRHFILDATEGIVRFGDGEHGQVVPRGTRIVAAYLTTRAEAGNLATGTIDRLANGVPNTELIPGLDAAQGRIARVTNPVAASGGAAAETLADAEARVFDKLAAPTRALTVSDYETLAMQTPGVRLARASARANLYAPLPCYPAPGVITVIILPDLPVTRPMPNAELRRAVRAYLNRRRAIGTRVEIVGPTYTVVSVRATVRGYPGSGVGLRERVIDALNRFFDPLTGGPDGTGWPFGRDVYRSEVLQVIDDTPGVDHVVALELLVGGEAHCANVCLGALGLVDAGEHAIEIVGGGAC